jgi:hypothetical protein
MSDSFTEVSNQSWFSRIGAAFKGILFGLLLFVVGFPVLFMNEKRSVETYKSLKEGAANVVEVSADTVDPAMAGKLIHISGDAVTTDTVADRELGIELSALKLRRDVEIYQWVQSESTSTKKNVGGSTTKETTYSYDKKWVSSPVDSSSFKQPEGRTNTGSMTYSNTSDVADPITVGAFTLSSGLVNKVSDFEPLPLPADYEMPAELDGKAVKTSNGLYVGKAPGSPEIGDLRIQFQVVNPGPVSVVAQQVQDTFEPYAAKAGKSILLLQSGVHSAGAMFDKAQADNRLMTWLIRGGGFLLMGIGLSMVFKPLSVLADVLPILGNIVGAGTGMIAFLLAFCFSTVTIAIAWIVYRPLLGVLLLAAAIGSIVLVRKKLKAADPVPAIQDAAT